MTECAASLGLLGTPKIKFLNKIQKNARQGVPAEQNAADGEHDDQSSSDTGSEDDIDKGHGSSEEGRGESNVRIAAIFFLTSRSHLHKISRKLKYGRNTIESFHTKPEHPVISLHEARRPRESVGFY